MKTSNFNCIVLSNSEPVLDLMFNFDDANCPKTQAEVVGTITHRFMQVAELNKRWKTKKFTSRDAISFQFIVNGIPFNSANLTDTMGFNLRVTMNKTIEAKIEYFLWDVIDFARMQNDKKVYLPKHIQLS
jgi:hypothetical protein